MQQTGELTALNRAFVTDPWSVYQRLRQAGPVQRAVLAGGEPVWLVGGYGEARALLADPRLSTDYFGVRALLPGAAGPYESPLSAHMLNTDPPAHTRLRALVAPGLLTEWERRLDGLARHGWRIQPRGSQLLERLRRSSPDGQVCALERHECRIDDFACQRGKVWRGRNKNQMGFVPPQISTPTTGWDHVQRCVER